MLDKQETKPQATAAQATDEAGYDPSAIEVLAGLSSRRRPWQLLMTGEGINQINVKACESLARILNLFPSVSHLVIKTMVGDCQVSRDFPSNYMAEVDQHLVGIFHGNPAVTGITFPTTSGRPGYTSTPNDPHWSPDGKASADIMAAFARGEIGFNEAIVQLDEVYRQKPT
ncbi:MAG: hypothetical protein ACRYG8_06550 [Janthinobacterium lividum]